LNALLVSISKLAETGDYNLSADRYREVIRVGKQTFPLVTLKDICEINPETAVPTELFGDTEFTYIDISSIENGSGKIDYSNKLSTKDAPSRARRLIKENDVLLSTVRPNLKAFAFIKNLPKKSIASTGFAVLRATKRILPEYLYAIIFDDKTVSQMIQQMGKGAYPSINQSDVESLQIPLPPLEIQRQLVDEIAAHQRIIDGACQVVEGWMPDIELELSQSLPKGSREWKIATFADVCEITSSIKNGKLPQEEIYIGSDSIESDTGQILKKETIGEQGIRGPVYYFEANVILYSKIRPNLNKVAFVDFDGYCSSDIYPLKNKENIDIQFLKYYLLSSAFMKSIHGYYERVGIPKLNREKLFTVEIPLPPLEIQREIIVRIETERAIVHGNRELIRLYEEKVKKVIERVWEG